MQPISEMYHDASSTIIEAFGNAATVLNINASRVTIFHKVLYVVQAADLQKRSQAELCGVYIDSYLLDCSRITSKPRDERNFHIPYILYQGIPSDEHEKYGILHPNQWQYTADNQYEEFDNMVIKDAERFYELTEAMNAFRIDTETQSDLFRIISAIFNLGNVQFIRQPDGFCAVAPASMETVNLIADLLEIRPEKLKDLNSILVTDEKWDIGEAVI